MTGGDGVFHRLITDSTGCYGHVAWSNDAQDHFLANADNAYLDRIAYQKRFAGFPSMD